MPKYEKICYCGGPVISIRAGLDKKQLSHCYLHRRLLYGLRSAE